MVRVFLGVLAMGLALGEGAFAQAAEDERLWSCETSLQGERTQINYVRDAAYRENVGRIESRFSKWGKVSCPGYVTLREILRRNGMQDDGNYCVLWDEAAETYVGAQLGPRKGNAVCSVGFCQRVNATKAATFQGANAAAVAGYEAIRQRPGATLLSATTGQLAGTIEGAGAVATGLASSPVAAGAVLIGAAATGGALWYCSDAPVTNVIADEPLAAPEPFEPEPGEVPAPRPEDSVVWTTPLPPPVEAAPAEPAVNAAPLAPEVAEPEAAPIE